MSLARQYPKLTAAAIVFILQILVPTVFSQVVTSNVTNQNVCSGDVITFDCNTTGSGGIAWSSDDYIGTGLELEFNIGDTVGAVRMSRINPNVVATFLRNEVDGSGNPLLRSQLTLTVSSAFPSHSVTCVSVSDRSQTHTVRQTLAVPDVPSNMTSNQTMDTIGNCVVHLAWRPPVNIAPEDLSHYMIHIDGDNIANKTHEVTNNSSLQLFAYPVCTCNNHTVSVQAVSRCERAGGQTESGTYLSQSFPTCNFQTTELTTASTAKIEECEEIKCDKSALIGIIIFLSLVVIVLAVVSITFVVWYLRAKKELESKTIEKIEKVEKLEDEIKCEH